jgi:hypothetical protein
MSDYLGNLAARSLEPAQAVRPRLASRFEPLAPWAPPLGEERTAAAPALVEETHEEMAAAPLPVRAPEPPRRLSAPREEPRQEEPPAPSRRRRARRAKLEEPEEVEMAAPEPVRPVMPVMPVYVPAVTVPIQRNPAGRSALPFEASPPGPLSGGERGKNGESRELLRHAVRPDTRDGAHSAPYSPTTPEKNSLSTRVEKGGEASRADRPGDRQSMENRTVSTVLQPKVTLAERDPFPVRRETPVPAPTIQVTIGRIEVRATPAPKAPARERPSAPAALSLEDYLKQRSRGEGR